MVFRSHPHPPPPPSPLVRALSGMPRARQWLQARKPITRAETVKGGTDHAADASNRIVPQCDWRCQETWHTPSQTLSDPCFPRNPDSVTRARRLRRLGWQIAGLAAGRAALIQRPVADSCVSDARRRRRGRAFFGSMSCAAASSLRLLPKRIKSSDLGRLPSPSLTGAPVPTYRADPICTGTGGVLWPFAEDAQQGTGLSSIFDVTGEAAPFSLEEQGCNAVESVGPLIAEMRKWRRWALSACRQTLIQRGARGNTSAKTSRRCPRPSIAFETGRSCGVGRELSRSPSR